MRYAVVLLFCATLVGCGSKQRFSESLAYGDAAVGNMFKDIQQVKQNIKEDHVERESEIADVKTDMDLEDEKAKYDKAISKLVAEFEAAEAAIAVDDPDRGAKLRALADAHNKKIQAAGQEYANNIQVWERKRLKRYADVHDGAAAVDRKFSGIEENFQVYQQLREGQNKYLQVEQQKAVNFDRAFKAGTDVLKRVIERREKADASP